MTAITRRRVAQLLGGAALAAAALPLPAVAQAYPEKPVTLVVPFAAGGSTDLVSRVIAQKMSEILGVQVLVDNKGGAGGKRTKLPTPSLVSCNIFEFVLPSSSFDKKCQPS